MEDMFLLLAITGLLNGLIGVIVMQKIYKQGASIVDRMSIGVLICGAVALSGSALSDFYVYREWSHWPEATITIAVLMRLCLRLTHREDYRIPSYRPSVRLQ